MRRRADGGREGCSEGGREEEEEREGVRGGRGMEQEGGGTTRAGRRSRKQCVGEVGAGAETWGGAGAWEGICPGGVLKVQS